MKVTWADVAFVGEPGAIPWLDGELIIEQKHIANWAANPTVAYEVALGGHFAGRKSIFSAVESANRSAVRRDLINEFRTNFR